MSEYKVFLAVSIDGEPAFGTVDGKRFNWEGSVSWCLFPGLDYILRYYTEEYEPSRVSFLKEFYPLKSGLGAEAGWLSPEGVFYHAKPGNWVHERLAEALGAHLFNRLLDDRDLERRGWLRVYIDGLVVAPYGKEPTQAQLDTMFDLSQLSEAGQGWREQLSDILVAYQ
jgi:hypothetical protein